MPDTFRALYGAHYRAVCRYLAARTDADVVEDVAAETFLVAWRRLGDVPEHERAWLLATAGKCLANDRRSRERSGRLAERLGAVAAATASCCCSRTGTACDRARSPWSPAAAPSRPAPACTGRAATSSVR